MTTTEKAPAPAQNPRYEAMKSIVQNRLNDNSTESGQSLREVMESQGVTMVDPDNFEAPPETKDSDSHVEHTKTVGVDIKKDVFEPEDLEKGVKTELAQEPEQIATEEGKQETKEAKEAEEDIKEETSSTAPIYEKDGKYYTKIKVNGAEEEIDLDKLKASAQKDQASFERFQAAAKKEQEIAAREAALEAATAKQAVTPQPTVTNDGATDTVDVKEKVDELYDSLAYADEDTVKAKLAEIVSGPAQPQGATGREDVSTQQNGQPVDLQAEINAALEQKAMQDWEAARTAAVAQWEIDYSDISGDAALRDFANLETIRIARENPNQAIEVTLSQAGEKARQWRDFQSGVMPAASPATEIDTESRVERKREAAAPVRTNSTTATKKVVDDKPQSRSDIVAQIRAGRGQPAV